MPDNVLTTERCELKYYVSLADAVTLSKRLSAVLSRDSYSANGSYRVKSLYFDSICDGDFYSKVDGDNIRKKIRLRIYDESMDRA
ncbi:MAG: VTC domain-containing protein, partial [Clostridia bacterium]|nr:VTC domain-containing protein [Clostridia bacterium]